MSPIDRDSDGDAIDEHAGMFSGVEQPSIEPPRRSWKKEHRDEKDFLSLTWERWGDPEQLRAFYLAMGELADKLANVSPGHRPPMPPREEPFASVSHALTSLAIDRMDGVSGGRTAGAFLIEINHWGTRIQWSSKAGVPTAIGNAEDLHAVRQAWARAFAELPSMCPLLREECELVTLWRYVGIVRERAEPRAPTKDKRRSPMKGERRTEEQRAKSEPVLELVRLNPGQIAERLSEMGASNQTLVPPRYRVSDEAATLHVTPKQIGRVTRWGAQRVYEFLRERGLVQREAPDEAYRGKVESMSDGVSVFGNDLLGWKAIADFLEVSVRTAQVYANKDEAERLGREPMPVMVLPTRTEASRATIRAWAEANLKGAA